MTSLEASQAGRSKAARFVLLGAGVFALAAFLWMPLLDGRAFFHSIVEPAWGTAALSQSSKHEALLDALGMRVVDGQFRSDDSMLSPLRSLQAGLLLAKEAEQLDELRRETLLFSRFVALSSGVFALLSVLCFVFALSPWPGVGSWLGMVVPGACALLLLASHLLGLGFDLLMDTAFFSTASHPLSALLVLSMGVGTALPIKRSNAFITVFGTLFSFILSALTSALWLSWGI
ncbi:MAG: hypothetical protein RBU37_03475 [Myxococcota bacterium]|jgi:hypothetical protein|nr:hypothetical protein [Myxococcota bacterium]